MGSNAFDLIVIALLAYSAYRGFSKGLISSAASLIALLAGVWGAIKFSSITARFLADFINVDPKVMGIVAFAVTFILIVVLIHFVAKTIEKLAEAVALGIINKLVGAAFGVLKFAFIISVVLVVINAANTRMSFLSPEFQNESLLYKPLAKFAPTIFKYLDFEEIKHGVEEKADVIDV